MITPTVELTAGIVAPRYRYVPDTKAGDFGAEITDMMGLFGRQLDDEQQAAVADLSSYDSRGRWVALESGVVEARQNGKTAATVLPVTLHDLFHMPPDRICWTAHLFKTARSTFEDVDKLLEAAPEYSRRVLKISRSHGEEGVYLTNGGSLEFLARENVKSGRGLGGKRTVMDEALIMKPGIISALVPTLSARKWAHVNYASSAALAGAQSDHLRDLVKRGRYAKAGDRFIWLEWCAPGGWGTNPCDEGDNCPHDGRDGCRYPLCELGIDCPHTVNAPNCALDNIALIQQANHSLGREREDGSGISVEYVKDERISMRKDPRGYGRERLGWHDEPPVEVSEGGVNMTRFRALENPDLLPPGLTDTAALVVDQPPRDPADPDSAIESTSIGVAWWVVDPKTGTRKAAIMVHKLGTVDADAVVDFVASLLEKADFGDPGIQASGQAGSLIKPLRTRGEDGWPTWDVHAISEQEAAQAVGFWLDGIKHQRFWHLGQQELLDAQESATLRKYGHALVWQREPGTDISALHAATLALHRLQARGDDSGPNIW